MNHVVTVIIPYFQRQPGVLSRALDSIQAQTFRGSLRVIVVDDSSPAPPREEILASKLDATQVTLLWQDNAGPGAARNRGLEGVDPASDFVAFLDSDDQWLPWHIENAVAALAEGDFYFSNHREPDSDCDQFSLHGKIIPKGHVSILEGCECYRFNGDMVSQIISANVIETSTVVFRRATFGELRFRPGFRNAFEDHLFWLDAARSSDRFVFSTKVGCQYGRGVSIWRSTGLGSDLRLPQLIDQCRYYKELLEGYVTSSSLRATVGMHLRDVRRAVVAEELHRLRRRMSIKLPDLVRYLRIDPWFAATALPLAVRIAVHRMFR